MPGDPPNDPAKGRPKWCICEQAWYARGLLDPACRHDYITDLLEGRQHNATPEDLFDKALEAADTARNWVASLSGELPWVEARAHTADALARLAVFYLDASRTARERLEGEGK